MTLWGKISSLNVDFYPNLFQKSRKITRLAYLDRHKFNQVTWNVTKWVKFDQAVTELVSGARWGEVVGGGEGADLLLGGKLQASSRPTMLQVETMQCNVRMEEEMCFEILSERKTQMAQYYTQSVFWTSILVYALVDVQNRDHPNPSKCSNPCHWGPSAWNPIQLPGWDASQGGYLDSREAWETWQTTLTKWIEIKEGTSISWVTFWDNENFNKKIKMLENVQEEFSHRQILYFFFCTGRMAVLSEGKQNNSTKRWQEWGWGFILIQDGVKASLPGTKEGPQHPLAFIAILVTILSVLVLIILSILIIVAPSSSSSPSS